MSNAVYHTVDCELSTVGLSPTIDSKQSTVWKVQPWAAANMGWCSADCMCATRQRCKSAWHASMLRVCYHMIAASSGKRCVKSWGGACQHTKMLASKHCIAMHLFQRFTRLPQPKTAWLKQWSSFLRDVSLLLYFHHSSVVCVVLVLPAAQL